MGFFKVKKIKRGLKHYMSMKAVRKKLRLTGKSRHIRQIKRSLKREPFSFVSSEPTSASDVGSYQYSGRSISQLMGGV